MRRFESLVMSTTEPVTDGTLWLKKKKSTIKDQKPNELIPMGTSIWYFGEIGWQPLIDFDTRYNLNDFYKYTSTTKPIEMRVTPHHEIGIVDIDRTYFMYDGSRNIGNNGNIVNERGLKKHVDDLQNQINTLKEKVSELEEQVASHTTQIENNRSSISNLTNRVSELETTV